MQSVALILFAREPIPGRVKTRLARSIGADEAAAIYQRLLARSLEVGENARFDRRYLYCAEADELDYFTRVVQAKTWQLEVQSGLGIGERMEHALEQVLSRHDGAVLIGSDVIDGTSADLGFARDSLGQVDNPAVLGPTADGGYWLIGLRRLSRDIFLNIPWSTGAVADLTRGALVDCNYELIELELRRDVDEFEDLQYLPTDLRG